MREATPRTIYLKDYTPPPFLIDRIELDVDIRAEDALVTAKLALRRNPASPGTGPLLLDGDELELLAVAVDGRSLAAAEYTATPERLVIPEVPDAFALETVSRIVPQKNTKLEGLYGTRNGFVTQCEAQGFRRITWFIDRPDVMARYVTTVHADRGRCPVLLANGNLVASGEEPGGRHWARFDDPFPKPSYLFALVAATLDKLEEVFVTRSGKEARLFVYVEPGKLDQAGWAMDCLKRAMRWDERRFGLELDLDHYKIVAVGDFNSGAMENKGLNIFNTKYVLARPDTATDTDYFNIDRVVAHEYFHNWTGNRVTCRDWFQLSLKEGLTVFRDQEYGSDTYSRPVQRIQEVRALRSAQFPEDAGPMAHPVRPQSYMEIRNFYTMTVYEKGAEVVRMQHTLLGEEGFRRGMDLYFQRHDGRAVTCDDFVQAMQDASGVDLTQFRRWYDQAGTPVLDVTGDYDASARSYTLSVRQHTPPTPGQPEKLPLHIPFTVGLVDRDGNDLPLRLEGEAGPAGCSRVLSVKAERESFRFLDVPERPVPSLLRNFSAPAIVNFDYSDAELAHLMAHDSDPFNRWEAGQRLATRVILAGVEAACSGRKPEAPEGFVSAFARVLADAGDDPAFATEALTLPSETYIAEQMEVVDPDAIHAARLGLRRTLAQALRPQLQEAYEAFRAPGPYRPDAAAAGRRALRNLALAYLMELEDPAIRSLCVNQFHTADNMTEVMAALTALANCDCPERPAALDSFYAKWKQEPLVVDKWLAVQAGSRLPSALEDVKRLAQHPAFQLHNPNKVYALIRSFAANQVRFHAADGAGYAFLADIIIELDALNPQVAARVARAFDRWRKFDSGRQAHARAVLTRIRDTAELSPDVFEVVSKALA
jgi:aminopeptidase N